MRHHRVRKRKLSFLQVGSFDRCFVLLFTCCLTLWVYFEFIFASNSSFGLPVRRRLHKNCVLSREKSEWLQHRCLEKNYKENGVECIDYKEMARNITKDGVEMLM